MAEINSMTIQFNVNNQTLTKTSTEKIVEHSVNYLYAQFTFNSNWDNVDKKYLIVQNEELGTNRVLLDNENKALIPSIYVIFSRMVVALIGVDENDSVVITTNPVYIPIYKTLVPYGEDPFLKYVVSTDGTVNVNQSGDRVDLGIPNIYVTDGNLTNDVLNLLGRNSVLLKAINMPYGLVNDITLALDQETYTLTLNGYDKSNNLLFTRSVDFNIETKIFKTIYYDSANEELVFVTMDDEEIRVPIGDILTGIATQDWVNANFYTKVQVNGLLAQKQDKLVNQSNIKSINGISILGSGNIDTQNLGFIELDFSEAVDNEISITDEQLALMQKDYAVVKVETDYFDKKYLNTEDNLIVFFNTIGFQTMLNSGVRESVMNYIVVNTSEKTATKTTDYAFSFYEKYKVDELLATKQNVINNSNKLSADLIEEKNNKKFVTDSEKTQITTNQNAISGIKDGQSIDSFGDVETALGNIQNGTTINNFSGVESALAGKQDTLSGSTSIDLTGNVVSVKESYMDSQFLSNQERDDLIDEIMGVFE